MLSSRRVLLLLVPAALWAVAARPAGGADRGEDLLRQAGAAWAAAEKDIADARKRHLAERKALAGQIQRAYADLAAAKAQAEEAQGALEALRAESSGIERSAALVDSQVRNMLAQASSCSGAS